MCGPTSYKDLRSGARCWAQNTRTSSIPGRAPAAACYARISGQNGAKLGLLSWTTVKSLMRPSDILRDSLSRWISGRARHFQLLFVAVFSRHTRPTSAKKVALAGLKFGDVLAGHGFRFASNSRVFCTL